MNDHKDKLSLEEAFDQYFSLPVPRKEFLTTLEQSLQTQPSRSARSFPIILRRISLQPVTLFLAISGLLIISLLVVGPANAFAALQGLLRYLPGYGIVDENTPLRMLSRPVSITREGVTLTVKQALLSPAQASITYIIKDVPYSAKPQGVVSEAGSYCAPLAEIRLPDGTRLRQQSYGSAGYDEDNHYQYLVKFPPIGAMNNQVKLFLSCIPDTIVGKAPENWEVPLKFDPAPASLAMFPVEVITPSPVIAQPTPVIANPPETQPAFPNPVVLEKAIETVDGYIFIGQFRQVLPAYVTSIQPQILDGNGLLQGYSIPSDINVVSSDQAIAWAYQIHTKSITWPLTIRFEFAQVDCSNQPLKLTFDVGSDPQTEQVLRLDKDYVVGPCKFHIDFIKSSSKGYQIRLSGIQYINSFYISPWVDSPMPTIGSTVQYPDHIDLAMTYPAGQQPPQGLITLYLSTSGPLPGPWQVEWQPTKNP